MKTLIIDNEPTMLWNMAALMRGLGAEVQCAPSAGSGLGLLAKGDTDVLLIDYELGDHDAPWVLRNWRVPPETTVIVVSACVNATRRAELRLLGVTEVLEKPFTAEQLLTLVERNVRKGKAGATDGHQKPVAA